MRTIIRKHIAQVCACTHIHAPNHAFLSLCKVKHSFLQDMHTLQKYTYVLRGNHFRAYTVTEAGEFTTQDIFMFYVAGVGVGNVGVLYWCEAGTRVASEENSLPLAHINGVYLGKQVGM